MWGSSTGELKVTVRAAAKSDLKTIQQDSGLVKRENVWPAVFGFG